MLSRASLPARRATSACWNAAATRAQSTSASEPQGAAPKAETKRKARIPLAESFADLLIPSRDAVQTGSRPSNVGLASLGQDQFSGRGTLITRLKRLRRKGSELEEQQERQPERTPQPRQQQRERAQPRKTPLQNLNKRAAPGGGAKATSRKETQKAEEDHLEAPGSDITAVEVSQLPPQELVRKTDLSSLFSGPSPTTHQVVPLDISAASPHKASRSEVALERMVGDYSRYLPAGLAATPKETMKTAGPVGYASLALARVPAITLRQRQNALAVVSRLASPSTPSRRANAS